MFIREPIQTRTESPPTQFALFLDPPFFHIAPGGGRNITAFVQRENGFSGSVTIELVNAPSWLTCTPLTLGAANSNGTLVVIASQDAPMVQLNVTVKASSPNVADQVATLETKVVGVHKVTSQYGSAVVYDTTKIIDADTLKALNSYSNGVFSFSAMTSQLRSLARGDVLVVPPSSTGLAKSGLMRLVLSLTQQGGVVVQTVQATVFDELQEVRVGMDGSTHSAASGTAGVFRMPSDRAFSGSRDPQGWFEYGGVFTLYDQQFELGPANIGGDTTFNFHGGITVSLLPGIDISGVFHLAAFKMHIAFAEDLTFSLQGSSGSNLNWEEPDLQTLFDDQIPIIPGILWVSVKASLEGRASGNLNQNINLNMQEAFFYELGPTYDDGSWYFYYRCNSQNPAWILQECNQPTFDRTFTISPGTGSDAKLGIGPRIQIGVNGDVGLASGAGWASLSGDVYFNLKSQIPHKPSSWVEWGIDTYMGLGISVTIGKWGVSHTFSVEKDYGLGSPLGPYHLFDGPNMAPLVEITNPQDGATFDYNSVLIFPSFTATASDPETGDLCVGPQDRLVWSDEFGQIGTGCSVHSVHLAQEGVHHITFTATDSDGMSSSASVTVTVSAAKPDVSITKPIDNSNFMVGQPVTLEGFAMLGLSPFPCNGASGKLTFSIWLGESHIASEPESGTQNPLYCTAQTKFDKPGSYYIRLVARGPSGNVQAFSKVVRINIFEPSQGTNYPPSVQIILPHEGDQFIFSNDKINLQGTVFDPEGDPLGTYTWSYGSSLFAYPLVAIATGSLPASSTCTKDAPCPVAATLNAHDYCVNNPSGGDLFLTLAATETAPVEQTGYSSPQVTIHLVCGKPLSAPPNLNLGSMFWGGFLNDANSAFRAKPERKHSHSHVFSPVSRFCLSS
jgi:hypothetical protein